MWTNRRAGLVASIAAACTLALSALALAPAPAGAAGVTTHAWMGLDAIDRVSAPDLRALLDVHRDQVRAGAMFPDGGYFPGNVYGEEAHWSRFTDAYAARLLARTDCGDLARPDGPCAAEVAHLMGVVAHGTGDEVWDWLFEPQSPDRDEYYLPPALSGAQDGSGQELVMDIVAVGLYGRPVGPLPPLPSTSDLLAAFEDAGRTGVTGAMLATGQAYLGLASQVEAGWVDEHLPGILEEMPWMSENLIDAPGGVTYAATAIAGQWDSMWGRLRGAQPPTAVSVTYPADGQRGIPAAGWVRSYLPGSTPGRGGARTRISASLTYSLPYVPGTGGPSVPRELPAGAMTLTEVGSGPVPDLGGYPRAVPYGPDAGEHTIAIQPGRDLAPCTWHQVTTTEALLDARGLAVAPHSWTFRTGLDAAGTACADDPSSRDAAHVRRMYQDLMGRAASDGEVAFWTAQRAQGLSRERVAAALVGSGEHRRRQVESLSQLALGRSPGPVALVFWDHHLRSHTLTSLGTLLLASPEAYARLGGTNAQYVEQIYPLVVGRPPDPFGASFWPTWLDEGRPRSLLPRLLLGSREAARTTIGATYTDLLGRDATAAELERWTGPVAAADVRVLLRAVLETEEYVERAQTP